MHLNIKSGSSHLLVLMLIIVMLSVAAFGFIIFVSKWDQRVSQVGNDTVNLSGINYNSEIYNATNTTIHNLSLTMPVFVGIALIFFIVVFITLLALVLKR